MCHRVVKTDEESAFDFPPAALRLFSVGVTIWSVLYMHMCRPPLGVLVSTCVLRSQDGSRSFGKRVWVACTRGCRREAALFCMCVCERVCVWCGQRLKRASVHMGTNDRICFTEPVSERKERDERNRASKSQRRGLGRPPTEVSLQRQMVSPRSPVLTPHPRQLRAPRSF